jgi:hypothetical protein
MKHIMLTIALHMPQKWTLDGVEHVPRAKVCLIFSLFDRAAKIGCQNEQQKHPGLG